MTGVFVDTAGWMACADGAEPAHVRAVAARDAMLEQGHVLVTHQLRGDARAPAAARAYD